MKDITKGKAARPGYRWVCCRYRYCRGRKRILDAHTYGYQAWCFQVRV